MLADGEYIETKTFEVQALGEFIFPVEDKNLNTKLAYLIHLDNSENINEKIKFVAYLREKRTDGTFRQVKAEAIRGAVSAPFDINSGFYSYIQCSTNTRTIIPVIFNGSDKNNFITNITISTTLNRSFTGIPNLKNTLTAKTGKATVFLTNDAISCNLRIKNGNTIIDRTNANTIYPKGYIVHNPDGTAKNAKLYLYNAGASDLVARLDKYSEDGTLDEYSAIEIPAFDKKVITLSGANKAKTYHISSSMPFIAALSHGTKTEIATIPLAVSKAIPVTEQIAISNIAQGASSFKYVISNSEGTPVTSGTEWVPEFARRKFDFSGIANPEDTVTILPTPNTLFTTECNHMGECAPAPQWALVGSIISSGAALENDNELPLDAYNTLWAFNEHTQDPLPCLDNNSKSCGVNDAVAKLSDSITPIAMPADGNNNLVNKNRKLRDVTEGGTCEEEKPKRHCYACLYNDFTSHKNEKYEGLVIPCTADSCMENHPIWSDHCSYDQNGNCVPTMQALCSKKRASYHTEKYISYSDLVHASNAYKATHPENFNHGENNTFDPYNEEGRFVLDRFLGIRAQKPENGITQPRGYNYSMNNGHVVYYDDNSFSSGLRYYLQQDFQECDDIELHISNHSEQYQCPIVANTVEVCNSELDVNSIDVTHEGCDTFGDLQSAIDAIQARIDSNPEKYSNVEIVASGYSQVVRFDNTSGHLQVDDFTDTNYFAAATDDMSTIVIDGLEGMLAGAIIGEAGGPWGKIGGFIVGGLAGVGTGAIENLIYSDHCTVHINNQKYTIYIRDGKTSLGLPSCNEKIRKQEKIYCEIEHAHVENCQDQASNERQLCCFKSKNDFIGHSTVTAFYEYSDSDNKCICNEEGSACSKEGQIEKCNVTIKNILTKEDMTETTVQFCNNGKWEKIKNCVNVKAEVKATLCDKNQEGSKILCYDDRFVMHTLECQSNLYAPFASSLPPSTWYGYNEVNRFSIPEADGYTNVFSNYDLFTVNNSASNEKQVVKYVPLPVVNQYNEVQKTDSGKDKLVCCPDYGKGYDGGQKTYYKTCCDEGLHYSLRRQNNNQIYSSAFGVHGHCCPDGTEWKINNNGLNGACCKEHETPCGNGKEAICCGEKQQCVSWRNPQCAAKPDPVTIYPLL